MLTGAVQLTAASRSPARATMFVALAGTPRGLAVVEVERTPSPAEP